MYLKLETRKLLYPFLFLFKESKLLLADILHFLSFHYFIFQVFIMPCERVNCAQCLTLMAARIQTRRVKQFLAHLDKTKPFDPYVVVAVTSCLASAAFLTTRVWTYLKSKIIYWSIPARHNCPSTQLSISHGSKSTMDLSSLPIVLHHLSLQDRRSWHLHHNHHVRLLQSPLNPPRDMACVWISWIGLGQG